MTREQEILEEILKRARTREARAMSADFLRRWDEMRRSQKPKDSPNG